MEEQREHFQNWLVQAQQAYEQAIRERNRLAANCSEGSTYLEQLHAEHRQLVEQNETKYQAAVRAAQEARATTADDASKVIDLTFQRDELNNSLAIAEEKIKSFSTEIATVKNQSSISQEAQAETIKDLRQDNSELKQQMDELRQVVQALSNTGKASDTAVPPASPVKPGLFAPEIAPTEPKPEATPAVWTILCPQP